MHGSVRGEESRGSLRGLRAGPASFPRPPAAGSRFPPSLQLLGGGVVRCTRKVSGKNPPSLVSPPKSAAQGSRGRCLAEVRLCTERRGGPDPSRSRFSLGGPRPRGHAMDFRDVTILFAACTGPHPGNCRASYSSRPTPELATVAEDRLAYCQ